MINAERTEKIRTWMESHTTDEVIELIAEYEEQIRVEQEYIQVLEKRSWEQGYPNL